MHGTACDKMMLHAGVSECAAEGCALIPDGRVEDLAAELEVAIVVDEGKVVASRHHLCMHMAWGAQPQAAAEMHACGLAA
jgi:hypothetical protein